MKPILSPMQLNGSCVLALSVTANPHYDVKKKVLLDFQKLLIESTTVKLRDDDDEWLIRLKVSFAGNEKDNIPYAFMVEMEGSFRTTAKCTGTDAEKLVKVNGSSVLFSAAREILRDTMARGPYNPIVLPTVSFVNLIKSDEKSGSGQ